jgi:hypothetical protein
MRYSTDRSYRDSVMVEVEKVVKRLEAENQKDKNFFSSFWFLFVKIYKNFLNFCKFCFKPSK